jgi:hypothetical protein
MSPEKFLMRLGWPAAALKEGEMAWLGKTPKNKKKKKGARQNEEIK